jgi:hypothetical protein
MDSSSTSGDQLMDHCGCAFSSPESALLIERFIRPFTYSSLVFVIQQDGTVCLALMVRGVIGRCDAPPIVGAGSSGRGGVDGNGHRHPQAQFTVRITN